MGRGVAGRASSGFAWLAAAAFGVAACATPADGAPPPAPGVAGHRVLGVAHRGGAGLAPENTLAAFQAGLDHGADAVELDVHLSRDGELVVMHDAKVARTTNGSGEIGEMSLAEIRGLDASARYFGSPVARQTVPTLQEVLDLVKGRAAVQIEIKLRSDGSRYPGIEERVVEAVRRNGLVESVVVISFDFPTLVAIKAIDPRVKTGALISRAYLVGVGNRGPAAVAAEIAGIRADFVGVEKTWLSEALYAELRAKSLGVGVWTVDDEATMRRFADVGVDFITSNRPDLLRSVLSPGP